MKIRLQPFLLFGICFLSAFTSLSAQRDSAGAYCNVFYITSDDPALLPFHDHCFIADQYSIADPTDFKAAGPVDGSISLFDHFPWVMHFYLPTPKANERISVAPPADLNAKNLKMKAGTMFITICDNRSSSRFDEPLDNVDFAAVSGNAKVLEFKPKEGKMPYAEYKLQMDLRFRKVDQSSGSPKLIGESIRVKMVVVIQAKLD